MAAINFKLLGVPAQVGEDEKTSKCNFASLKVLEKIAMAAKIDGFRKEQVDVCHRVSEDYYSPMIVRFHKMADKCNFYEQKSKLRDITPLNANLSENDAQRAEKIVEIKSFNKNFNKQRPAFMLQEHLTKRNRNLLKKTKEKAKGLGYKFPGYVTNNEVRCRKVEGGRFVSVKCIRDLAKII